MSWDGYIDSLILYSKPQQDGTAHIDKACFVGVKDSSQWTTDANASNLQCSAPERAKIIAEINKGDQNEFGANGIVVGGVKYQFLRYDADTKTALGKKKGSGAITVQLSIQVLIIAHCPEGGQHGICNEAVQKMTTYLQSNGY